MVPVKTLTKFNIHWNLKKIYYEWCFISNIFVIENHLRDMIQLNSGVSYLRNMRSLILLQELILSVCELFFDDIFATILTTNWYKNRVPDWSVQLGCFIRDWKALCIRHLFTQSRESYYLGEGIDFLGFANFHL